MAKVKFEITVDLKGTDGNEDILDNLLPTEAQPTRSVKDVFKDELEKGFIKQSSVAKGDIQSLFVSSVVTDL
jgi:hypothetical protein